jgi:hypothetical protein
MSDQKQEFSTLLHQDGEHVERLTARGGLANTRDMTRRRIALGSPLVTIEQETLFDTKASSGSVLAGVTPAQARDFAARLLEAADAAERAAGGAP